MASKWVGDAIGTNGIYSVWIAMRKYPWLPRTDYHDKGETGADIMKHFEELVVVDNANCTLLDLGEFFDLHVQHSCI
jgi:chloride channel 3/4/5